MNRKNEFIILVLTVLLLGCGSAKLGIDSETGVKADIHGRSKSLANAANTKSAASDNRCDFSQPNREVSEYDTSGDDIADVRKVFIRVGAPPVYRLVMICREADINADGIKDVVRYYDDEGRPLREEADRDFDGQMDIVSFYQRGELLRKEIDNDANGIVDYKVFYEAGQPTRSERDLLGRSTATIWKANRWEYFESGRIIRMGTDLDGDGRVDRWDRNEELSHANASAKTEESATDD